MQNLPLTKKQARRLERQREKAMKKALRRANKRAQYLAKNGVPFIDESDPGEQILFSLPEEIVDGDYDDMRGEMMFGFLM